jgi:hypothetical protein
MNSHWSIKRFKSDLSFLFYWISYNKFSIYLSTWLSSNHHQRLIFSKFFISLKTTIALISTRKLSSKMNWILLLRIVFLFTNSSIICSFNETTIIMKIMFAIDHSWRIQKLNRNLFRSTESQNLKEFEKFLLRSRCLNQS